LGGARPPRPGIATGRHGGAIDLIPLQISTTTKNPELVYEFVRSIYSEEVYVKFLHAVPGGMIPTLTSVIEGEAFWDNPTIQLHKELVQASIEGLKTSSLIYMPFGINPYGAAIKNEHIMTKLLSFVALGEKTLDEAIDWAAAELRRIFTNVGTF
jgi:multiple sugar transport system substrate-binding protein